MIPLALLTASTMADFPPDYLLRLANRHVHPRVVAFFAYTLLAMVLLWFGNVLSLLAIWCAMGVALMRLVIDVGFGGRCRQHPGWFLFRHLLLTAAILTLVRIVDRDATNLLFGWCASGLQALRGQQAPGSIPFKAALLFAALLLPWLIVGSGRLIGLVICHLRERVQSGDASQVDAGNDIGEQPMGVFIGWVERALTLVLVMAGAYTGLGVLVAVKTAARYPEFRTRAFAEYYILGTLMSLLCGVVLSACLTGIARCV